VTRNVWRAIGHVNIIYRVRPLHPISGNVQEGAAAALSNLARDNAENQTTIANAGAIPPLIQLLGSGSAGPLRLNAARTLCNLTRVTANAVRVADAGGIPALWWSCLGQALTTTQSWPHH
jgi:hypothetical protein